MSEGRAIIFVGESAGAWIKKNLRLDTIIRPHSCGMCRRSLRWRLSGNQAVAASPLVASRLQQPIGPGHAAATL